MSKSCLRPTSNANRYYLLDQPSFLQAEITSSDRVLASTAGDRARFAAVILDGRVQKVQRYSFQRPFIGARIACRQDARLWLMFDEIPSDTGDVNWRRLGCCNIIEYRLKPGTQLHRELLAAGPVRPYDGEFFVDNAVRADGAGHAPLAQRH